MKKVTVLTLSYNSPDLWCAIDSVMAQTYENIHYVLVDDCSKDFCKPEVERYIAERNRGNITATVIVNEENQGITRSSNIGLKATDGEYIINLAGDDCFYDANVVADVVAEFEKTGAMVLTGYRSICDFTMVETGELQPTKYQVKKIKELTPTELFEEMAAANYVLGCCTSYRRSCMEQYGFYDETYRYLDDYTMNMKLLRNNVRISFFDRTYVKYRSSGVSSTTSSNNRYMDEADLVFANEIYPYSQDKKKAEKNYRTWKLRREQDREYAVKMENCKGNRGKRMLTKGMYYLSHPKLLVSKLIEKIS